MVQKDYCHDSAAEYSGRTSYNVNISVH